MQDPKVTAAVAKLQELKAKAAGLRALLVAFSKGNKELDVEQSPFPVLQGLAQ